MRAAAPSSDPSKDYVFRFDAPLEPVIFGGEADLSGWLLHREGKPINGIRAVVKRPFWGRKILRARRKRTRPDVGAAFPHFQDAGASGFLLELRFGLGRSHLVLQVLDHDRAWRTFSTATVTAFPLTLLRWLGFSNVRHFAILYLRHFFAVQKAEETSAFPVAAMCPPRASRIDRVELFATTKSNLFIVEIGELVAAGFRELGYAATLHLDEFPGEDLREGIIQIVVTPHEYYNLFLSEKVSRVEARRLTRNVYLLCTEQPETGWFQSNLRWGVHSLGVADINPLGVAAYRSRGLAAYQLHLGYHPILSHPTSTPHSERNLDITFLGSLTSRRDEFFAEHAGFFARRRCHLRLVPLGFAKTKETRSYLSTERRNELLSQSRILLNLHYSEQKYFEWHRMLVGLANGCCIITETCKGYGALEPGKHFIMVEPEYLIPACEYFLAHPAECEKIAQAGRIFIETELRQAQTCGAFLREIEDFVNRPSPMPTDAAAAPLNPAFRQMMARHMRRSLWSALRDDVRNSFTKRNGKVKSEAAIADGGGPAEKERARIVVKREAYRSRLLEQETACSRGDAIMQFYENNAFRGGREPKLSVLITLYNYAQHIDACVASAIAAAERLSVVTEIVIVNDASTDDSLQRALRCSRRSKLAMRIVDKKFNTGLADARNTAVKIARAPYVFMMDADNLIFPESLRQLLAVISADDYAAAYSLICRFRGTPANGVGLLSYFDWDPQILVQSPYIDAMAMFSRQALLDLGGYDNQLSQIGWFGWEDYDMWLRFAQCDLRVGFVPNTLCLYRHHDTSMINTTKLFESELVRHFIDRYGDLLDRFEPRERIFGADRNRLLAPGQRDAPKPKTHLGRNAGKRLTTGAAASSCKGSRPATGK